MKSLTIRLRKPLVQSFIILAVLVALNVYIKYSSSLDRIYEASLRAFQGSTVIFSICVSLATLMGVNYVKGLRDDYWKRVANIREILEKVYAEQKSSNLPSMQKMVDEFILPMLYVTPEKWSIPDNEPIKTLLEIKTTIGQDFLKTQDFLSLPRGIIRLEEEIDSLFVQYVRRVYSKIIAKQIAKSFLLIAAAIACLSLAYLLPPTNLGKLVSTNLSILMITFVILETLIFSSHLQQHLLEEYPEELDS